MTSFNDPRAALEALSAPIGDLISSIGKSVADAQMALDAQTIQNFLSIYSQGGEAFEALKSIGYRPTWYQIPEVNAEISVALAVSGSVDAQGEARTLTQPGTRTLQSFASPKVTLWAAPMGASYTNKFNYDIKAASKVTFKIVPVPPSVAAEAIRVVPSVVGKKLSEARELLQRLDVPFSLPDSPAPAEADNVTGQSPAPGTMLAAGEAVALQF
jgi:hypothetical protein